jgi:hypothetical protein
MVAFQEFDSWRYFAARHITTPVASGGLGMQIKEIKVRNIN